MTVSSSNNRDDYAGNGSTTSFAVSFRFLQNSDIKATLRDSSGGETLQAETTNYTLTGAGGAGGGTLVMLVAPITGTTLTIQRDVPATQETDYVENDEFPAESHEDALDKLTMLVQQQGEDSTRHIGFSDTVSDATGSAVELSQDATQRADKFLGFDSAGNIVTKTASVAGLVDQAQQDIRYSPTFATVAAMTAANPVALDGVVVVPVVGLVLGIVDYATGNNSGLMIGSVVAAATGTADGGAFIDLDNGLQWRQNLQLAGVSWKQFGAVGDGTTNDSAVCQNLLAFAPPMINGGGSSYLVYNLEIKADAVIKNSTFLPVTTNGTNAPTFNMDTTPTLLNVRFEDVVFDGGFNAATTTTGGANTLATFQQCDRLEFHNCEFKGHQCELVNTDPADWKLPADTFPRPFVMIAVRDCGYVKYSGCKVGNFQAEGISAAFCGTVIADDCDFEFTSAVNGQTPWQATKCDVVLTTGNTFNKNKFGTNSSTCNLNGKQVIVKDNDFSNGRQLIISREAGETKSDYIEYAEVSGNTFTDMYVTAEAIERAVSIQGDSPTESSVDIGDYVIVSNNHIVSDGVNPSTAILLDPFDTAPFFRRSDIEGNFIDGFDSPILTNFRTNGTDDYTINVRKNTIVNTKKGATSVTNATILIEVNEKAQEINVEDNEIYGGAGQAVKVFAANTTSFPRANIRNNKLIDIPLFDVASSAVIVMEYYDVVEVSGNEITVALHTADTTTSHAVQTIPKTTTSRTVISDNDVEFSHKMSLHDINPSGGDAGEVIIENNKLHGSASHTTGISMLVQDTSGGQVIRDFIVRNNEFIGAGLGTGNTFTLGLNFTTGAGEQSLTVEDNSFENFDSAGCYVTGSTAATFLDIKGNRFRNNAQNTALATDYLKSGLVIDGTALGVGYIANNFAYDNQAVQTMKYGITVNGAHANVFIDNNMTRTADVTTTGLNLVGSVGGSLNNRT